LGPPSGNVGRGDRIVATARAIAAREGWSAVTVRRLADEIEYNQPVLYSHFKSRDAIVGAVAVEGFRESAAALRAAARGSYQHGWARQRVVHDSPCPVIESRTK
jgi:AcrR family transcriptional regulator